MSAFSHSGVVYFAVAGRYVKIGYSASNVQRRLRVMFNGSRLIRPDDIDESQPPALIHEIPGCIIRDERRIHALFARHHVIGEWYRYDLPFVHQLSRLDFVTERENRLLHRRAKAALKQERARRLTARLTPAGSENPRSDSAA